MRRIYPLLLEEVLILDQTGKLRHSPLQTIGNVLEQLLIFAGSILGSQSRLIATQRIVVGVVSGRGVSGRVVVVFPKSLWAVFVRGGARN